jgi:hypothetical protein
MVRLHLVAFGPVSVIFWSSQPDLKTLDVLNFPGNFKHILSQGAVAKGVIFSPSGLVYFKIFFRAVAGLCFDSLKVGMGGGLL